MSRLLIDVTDPKHNPKWDIPGTLDPPKIKLQLRSSPWYNTFSDTTRNIVFYKFNTKKLVLFVYCIHVSPMSCPGVPHAHVPHLWVPGHASPCPKHVSLHPSPHVPIPLLVADHNYFAWWNLKAITFSVFQGSHMILSQTIYFTIELNSQRRKIVLTRQTNKVTVSNTYCRKCFKQCSRTKNRNVRKGLKIKYVFWHLNLWNYLPTRKHPAVLLCMCWITLVKMLWHFCSATYLTSTIFFKFLKCYNMTNS